MVFYLAKVFPKLQLRKGRMSNCIQDFSSRSRSKGTQLYGFLPLFLGFGADKNKTKLNIKNS